MSFIIHWLRDQLADFGRISIMLYDAVRWSVVPPLRFRNCIKQMEFVGVKSFSIVMFTGIFTGAVLALHGYETFSMINMETMVGGTVAVAMAREMGPVLASIMVVARAGSAMAAELGTMRVTEQIDALVTMSINPVKYLVTPRLIAGITMMPILASIFSLTGFVGSYIVGVKILGINSGLFLANVTEIVDLDDYTHGMVKAVVFGLLMTLIACFHGFNARGGAEGVGKATNRAVVSGCVSIVVADYFLSALMFG